MVTVGPTDGLAVIAAGTAMIGAAVSLLSWQRREKRGATGLALSNAMATLWLAGYALELASGSLATAVFWNRIKVIGLNGIPIAWLLFAVDYTETDSISYRLLAGLALVPLTNVFVILTNGWLHTLSWTSASFVQNGQFSLLSLDFGVLWWPNVLYSYILITIGVSLLVRYRLAAVHVQRRQTDLVLLAGLPIFPANVAYYGGYGPYPALDLTPFMFVFTGLVIFWALFRYRLFDLAPVARRTVVEDMDDAMFVLDRDGQITDLNPAARNLCRTDSPLGEHISEVLPALAGVLTPKAVDDATDQHWDKTLQTDGANADRNDAAVDVSAEAAADTQEVTIERDGYQAVYDVKISYLQDRNERITGSTIVLHDITDRKRRADTLAALQDANQRMMRAENVAGVCTQVVDAASEVVGLRYVAVHVRDGDVLKPVAFTDDVRELFETPPTFAVGEGLQGTAYERGETLTVDESTEHPWENPETDIESALIVPLGEYGVLGAASDQATTVDEETVHFTEVLAASATSAIARADREETLRERERELSQQNERLEDFANVVSHDLRNPLSVASGHLAQVEDNDHVTATREALGRMEEIIDDVLKLARQGEPVRDPEPVSLAETARTAWDVVDTRSAELTTADLTLEADPSRLQQLLENLFRNSIDHGGADVHVRVGPVDEASGFFVEDDGPGIPPQDRDSIFESGFSTDSEGTGIGLAVVRQVVEDHGWTVTATVSEDGGARFEIASVETIPERHDTSER